MRSTVQELARFGPGLLGVAQMLASAAFCARFRGCDESWRYDASTGSPERAFRQRRRTCAMGADKGYDQKEFVIGSQ